MEEPLISVIPALDRSADALIVLAPADSRAFVVGDVYIAASYLSYMIVWNDRIAPFEHAKELVFDRVREYVQARKSLQQGA